MEEKKETKEQYIVVTALKTGTSSTTEDPIGKYIEDLVQRVSRIESYAHSVFTLMLLNRFESKCAISKKFITQSTISACIRSVCVRKERIRPLEVKYMHTEVQTCIRVAAHVVTQHMNMFDSDEGLTKIMDSS